MFIYWIALGILVIAGGLFGQSQYHAGFVSEQANLDSLSRSLLTYRTAAAAYAQSHPGFTGTPADASLNLPNWYVKQGGVSSYIIGGISYTFVALPPAGLPGVLAQLTESATVGTNQQGWLYSPKAGKTSITIPSVVPNGSVVAVY